MKKGKKYLEKEKLVDREISFNPNKAFELVKETGFARFDESIEVHFKLGIDPRHSDQQLRGTVVLPNKVLGAKGLMPNPKSGTVTPNIENAVKEFKAGKVEYRNDKYGIIHLNIGKKSFEKEKLIENFELVYNTLHKIKPAKAKGTYMKSISISTSMGPGIFIEPMDVKWGK